MMVQAMPGPPSKPVVKPAAVSAAKPEACWPGAQPTTTPPGRLVKSTTTVTPTPGAHEPPVMAPSAWLSEGGITAIAPTRPIETVARTMANTRLRRPPRADMSTADSRVWFGSAVEVAVWVEVGVDAVGEVQS